MVRIGLDKDLDGWRPENGQTDKFGHVIEDRDAGAKMRALLIQLAVQGKLVPNDSSESPVSLKLSGEDEDAAPFPSNWRSGLLGEVLSFEYGDNLPASKRSESGEYPVYGSNGSVGTHDTYLTREPAIIIGRKGSAGALNISAGPSWTTDVAYFVRPPRELDLRYTYYLLASLHLDELGKGIKPGLSRKEAYILPVAIPPLSEQKRIIAKVDELMVLCDRLEAQQEERETRQAALSRAAVARFDEAPTPANLNFLFHPSYSVNPTDLRRTILNLAVRGKLVTQEPRDEPAEKLFEHIQGERRRYAEAHGIRVNESTKEEKKTFQFEIPALWKWTSLSSLFNAVTDGDHLPPPKADSGIAFLTIGNITTGRLDFSSTRFVPDGYLSRSGGVQTPRHW